MEGAEDSTSQLKEASVKQLSTKLENQPSTVVVLEQRKWILQSISSCNWLVMENHPSCDAVRHGNFQPPYLGLLQGPFATLFIFFEIHSTSHFFRKDHLDHPSFAQKLHIFRHPPRTRGQLHIGDVEWGRQKRIRHPASCHVRRPEGKDMEGPSGQPT